MKVKYPTVVGHDNGSKQKIQNIITLTDLELEVWLAVPYVAADYLLSFFFPPTILGNTCMHTQK